MLWSRFTDDSNLVNFMVVIEGVLSSDGHFFASSFSFECTYIWTLNIDSSARNPIDLAEEEKSFRDEQLECEHQFPNSMVGVLKQQGWRFYCILLTTWNNKHKKGEGVKK